MLQKKVKLIATDVDGTLLKSGQQKIDSRVLATLERIKASGITLVIASGRKYEDLVELFGKVKKDVFFVCLDGALVIRNDEVLFKDVIETSTIEKLTAGLPCQECLKMESYGVGKDICKLAFYRQTGNNLDVLEMRARNSGLLKRVYQQKDWLEYVGKAVDKGAALSRIKLMLGISEMECAAFGDNINDIEMLRQVTFSYAVAGAKQEIKRMCKYETTDVVQAIEQDLL